MKNNGSKIECRIEQGYGVKSEERPSFEVIVSEFWCMEFASGKDVAGAIKALLSAWSL